MNFIELFSPNAVANDVEVLESLKRQEIPVVMYGASIDVADRIVKKLSANGITVAAVAYDDESPLMTDATALLKDTPTIPAKEIDRTFPACNVVPGFVKAYGNVGGVAGKFKNARSVSYLSEIFDMEIISPSFVLENKAFLENFYNNLSDQQSKDSLVAYLMSKTRQDMKYLPAVFDKIQYFPKGIFALSEKESYFDCGAFTGDTVMEFLKATGGLYSRIWAAEPDKSNCERLIKYVEESNLTNVTVINKGIYGSAGQLPFRADGNMLSMITDDSDSYIDVDTIDNIVAGEPVTYIKMDVEGAELEALKGAEQTIRKYKPILGISIYHRQSDLTDIPAYIKKIAPEYEFYFRVHKKLAIDTVLYAVVPASKQITL
ncbi:MAG: FkbM family methyltransferase [Tannerella sp.]|nr:FkbM family methyltransferase [Tannerella sp.]